MFTNTTKTLFTTIVLLLSSSCSIICGVACDWIEPGECLGVGEMFGPCTDQLTCSPDLTCASTKVGSICLPSAKAANDWAAAECAAWRGDMACSVDTDRCYLPCDGQDDCKGGTACDEVEGVCVYPYDDAGTTGGDIVEMCFEEGNYFGPCHDGECGGGLFCRNTASGSICLPSCSAGQCNSECAAAFGTTCDASGACVQSCDPTKIDCQDGQICDSQNLTCVWPNQR